MILKEFLQDQDVKILGWSLGEHISFGGVKGIWIDSDAKTESTTALSGFFGKITDNCYPGYIIPHEIADNNHKKTLDMLKKKYGWILNDPGFDRKAEPLKCIFELFETDEELKNTAKDEFAGKENPFLDYICETGINPFLTAPKKQKDNVDVDSDNDDLRKKRSISEDTIAKEQDESRTEKESVLDEETITGKDLKFLVNKNILGKIVAFKPEIAKPQRNDENDPTNYVLFIASLGGGTGTGFINPITKFVRNKNENFRAFALCVLTEKGIDVSRGNSEEQRNLAAVIAMYDLLTKDTYKTVLGVSCLILMDKEILDNKYGKDNYTKIDKKIFQAMRPFIEDRNFPDSTKQSDILAMVNKFTEDGTIKTPILVPCYSTQKHVKENERALVENALYGLNDGIKFFDCEPEKAEMAYVYTRGFLDKDEIRKAVQEHTNIKKEIMVYRKIGDYVNDEVLILLRNPYGGDYKAYGRPETFEKRIHGIVKNALNYLESHEKAIINDGMPDDTKIALGKYFYGEPWIDEKLKHLEGIEQKEFAKKLKKAKEELGTRDMPWRYLKYELKESLKRLENGSDGPFFEHELNVFTEKKVIHPGQKDLDTLKLNNRGYANEEDIRAIVRDEIKRMKELEQGTVGSKV